MTEHNNDLIGFIASTVETLRDQATAMRDDMTAMRREMVTSDTFDAAIVSVRGDIEQVQMRLDGIEHSVNSRFEHVEGELSRLRSAIYLLGKDRPEVLRLLGQTSS